MMSSPCSQPSGASQPSGGTMSVKRIRALALRSRSPASNAMRASDTVAYVGTISVPSSACSTGRVALGSEVRWNRPMTMSWVGMATGRPSEGLRMLLVDSIRMRDSACASVPRGRWTAI